MRAYDTLTVEARVRFRGNDISLNRMITDIDLDGIMPIDGFVSPFDYADVNERQERRTRLVDYIASEFAHALTEALFNKARK